MLSADELRQFISTAESLPTLPGVLFEILNCIDDENCSISDVKRIILKDPGITASILKVANSAWFGQVQRVEDISKAVIVLGLDEVLKISMYASFSTFVHESFFSTKFSPLQFWLHCIACSEAARIVAKSYGDITEESAVVNGLLHDVGKVMIYYLFPGEYEKVLQGATAENCCLLEVEKEQLGYTHPEIGKYLAEKWNFPLRLKACIEYHHFPAEAPEEYRNSVSLVSLSNNLVKSIGLGKSGNPIIDLEAENSGLQYSIEKFDSWKAEMTKKTELFHSYVGCMF